MSQPASYLPSLLALLPLLIASAVLTVVRPRLAPHVRRSGRFAGVVGLTILMQGLHFFEELRWRLFVELPQSLGFQPWTETLFVSFNVTWLVIWLLALAAVRAGVAIAVFPLWFLGLGMVLNLVAHPLLALRAGGYFPGLATSPLVGVLGILLIRELLRGTTSGRKEDG